MLASSVQAVVGESVISGLDWTGHFQPDPPACNFNIVMFPSLYLAYP